MKITKWGVHVHSKQDPDVEVASKYFLCGNDDKETVRRAIITGDDETFKQFLGDENYIVHVVDDTISEEERAVFMNMVKDDPDPENFFVTKS